MTNRFNLTQLPQKALLVLASLAFVLVSCNKDEITTSSNGCADTTSQSILVSANLNYHFPNAFSPNYDGNNDVFIGKGNPNQIADFKLDIYNRYGEVVFTSSDPNIGWNGKKYNEGKLVSQGMYVYVAQIATSFGTNEEFNGIIMLLH